MRAILKFKHYLLFVVIFFYISLCSVCAQQEDTQKNKSKKEFFAFGPKYSVNFSNEWLPQRITTDFLPGADLGLFFRFSPGRIYIQPEVFYAIRNQTFTVWSDPSFLATIRTHHIGMPILVGVKAIDFRLFKLRFFIGPELSVSLGNRLMDPIFQLGFQAGLGFDIWRFTIDAGYTFLSDIPQHRDAYGNILKVGVGFKCF